MFSHTPRGVRAAAAVLTLAAVAGCSDDLTAPAAAPALPGAGPAAAMSTSGPTLISNSVKYRDTGVKNATGRSGAAQVTARALLGRDGVTELAVTTGTLDQAGAPGNIDKLGVKAFDWYGEEIFTTRQNGLAAGGTVTRTFKGLARRGTLEVQTNVSGIDPARTDIVTVIETIKRRPDLSVYFYTPQRVLAGTPVNVNAAIWERNGDAGARTDCVLYVDGAAADRAQGIWVDAGDVVSCAFAPTLAIGTHTLEVRLERQAPADWNPADNASSATVEVVGGTDFYYMAHADDSNSRSHYRYTQNWRNFANGDFGEGSREDNSQEWAQRSSMYGMMPRQVPLPLHVSAAQSTSGQTVHTAEFDLPALDETGTGCVSAWENAYYFFLCTYGGQTSFQYERSAGTVTYHSASFYRAVHGESGYEYVYSYNYGYSYDYGTLVSFGSEYTFDVRVTGADGQEYVAATTFPLIEVVQHYVTPWSCFRYDDPSWFTESCEESDSYLRTNSGASNLWPN